MRAPMPGDERDRLEALRRYQVLDTPPELSYDDLVLLASEICGTPIAAISMVDEDRQWFKSILGLDVRQTPRDVAFCAHTILDKDQPLVVEDATEDPRFSDNALVVGAPGIRFYAGTPLVMSDGHAIGTLCVIDREPRRLSSSQRRALEVLGREVVAQLELRRNVDILERTVLTLERTQAELRRAQQEQNDLKDQFVSHVSHELRSPLTPIYQFGTILLDEIAGPLSAEQREYLGIILRNAEQLRALIDDLLDVTRAQTGKLRVERRRTRMDAVVADVMSALSVTAQAADVTLASNVIEPLPEVIADASRVRQVLSNLVENAIKFTNSGGRVSVHASVLPEEPGALRVTVEDTGCGLSAEDSQRVFEHLYQAGGGGERSR
ncbi:MAG: GAF domain-containing sensor histidine kinase, partial [Acidobacteriota bacterium]|nr:GAF domain-containing sensor histidine kinase [Acidobacteriota bacterium]